jgi:hypothetical protein
MATILKSASAPGPNFDAVASDTDLSRIIGALLTYGLLIAVLMVVICAAGWALGSASGSWQTASRAKTGVFVALLGSVLLGGGLAWANWLLDLGTTL